MIGFKLIETVALGRSCEEVIAYRRVELTRAVIVIDQKRIFKMEKTYTPSKICLIFLSNTLPFTHI